jgi:hypothetical protein
MVSRFHRLNARGGVDIESAVDRQCLYYRFYADARGVSRVLVGLRSKTSLELMVLEVGVEPTCPVKGAGF